MSDSRDPPWFLQRLALDCTADQRAIRRAYAREVKQIDQGADAQGFQFLREAYETALQWEAYQRMYAQQDAPSPAGAAPRPERPESAFRQTAFRPSGCQRTDPGHSNAAQAQDRQIDVQADPQQLSADVFEAFLAGCSGLAQGRTLHDASAWELHLRTCMNDDRLMNLAARGIFEARVLHLLAGGWRPGNETLLEAAADVFQWRSDRHRLLRFGHAGAIVDRAIDERSMFDNQEHDLKAMQRQVILRLRELDMPEPGQLRADMPHVEQLAARFPTWLELVASMDNLEQWRAAYATLPAPAQPPGYGAVPSAWSIPNMAHGVPHPAGADVDGSADGGDSRRARPAFKDRMKRIAWRFALGFIAFNAALALMRVLTIDDAAPGKSGPAAVAQPKRQPDIEYDAHEKKYGALRAEREARAAREAAAAKAPEGVAPETPPPPQ